MFEDSALNEKTVAAVEKQIHYGDSGDATQSDAAQLQSTEVKHVV